MILFFDQEMDDLATGSFKYAFEENIIYNFSENKNSWLDVQFPHIDSQKTKKYFFYNSDTNRRTIPIVDAQNWTYGKFGDLNSVVIYGTLDNALRSFKLYLANEVAPGIALNNPNFKDFMFLNEFSKIDFDSDVLTPSVVYDGLIPSNIEPVANAAPKNSFTASQFTASISWEPIITGGVFSSGVIYTANCTLTTKTGYTLIGVDSSIFTIDTINPATLTYANNILSIKFAKT